MASADCLEDLRLAAALSGLQAVMVPKAESTESLQRIGKALGGLRMVPIVETAAGRMVDKPIVLQARRVLARAALYEGSAR